MSEAGTSNAGADAAAATAAAAVAAEAAKAAGTKTNGDATKGADKATADAAKKAADTAAATEAATKAADEAAKAAKWYDPEKWRDSVAGKDEKKRQRLEKFASLENWLTRTDDVENKLRAGMLKPVLAADAGEAEVTDYRKAHGIPAEPTAEGYGLKFPDGMTPSETDKADLGVWLKDMHAAHVPAAYVQKAWATYLGIQDKAAQQLHDAAQTLTINQKAEVRAEMGRDYDRNMRIGNGFLATHLGEEKAKALTGTALADGTALGDHPDFVRLFVAAALADADDAALVTAEGGSGAGSIDEQYQKALALADTDPRAYHSEAHQAKLLRLVNARMKKAPAAA